MRARRILGLSVISYLCLSVSAYDSLAEDSDHSYVGFIKCKNCHKKEVYGDQITAWKNGVHARAFETLASSEALAVAAQQGIESPQSASECLRCHVTGHGVPEERVKFALDRSNGVQCESCHGPGSEYRKRSVMSDPDRARSTGLWDQTSEVCVKCHNPESPTWDPGRYPLPDGTTAGFHFESAADQVRHPIPEAHRGRVSEIEEELKRRKKR